VSKLNYIKEVALLGATFLVLALINVKGNGYFA